jgi:diguanylate cyclase (GGDEF)-like protein
MGEHELQRRLSRVVVTSGRPWVWAAVAAVASSVAFAAVLSTRVVPPQTVGAVDDLGELVAGLLGGLGAAFACVRARSSRQKRLAVTWGLVAAGVWAWALGEAVWSVYELALKEEVPFPSAADGGFLAMPVLAGAGLLLWPTSRAGRRDRISALLDGIIIASALLMLSWSLNLVATGGSDDLLATVIGAAYPLGDVLLASLAVLLLSRAEPGNRLSLVLLTCGVIALAVADSAFMYGTANGSYASGELLDVGWFAGFLAIGVAGLAIRITPTGGRDRSPIAPGWPRLLLPYLPTAFATVIFFSRLYGGRPLHPVQITCALADNRRLLATVRASEDQLRHQAFHDSLTGLPNRALFADRVDHALRLAGRDHLPRSVLFIDIDNFKLVNDGLGHAAGDRVLMDAAARLTSCVRDSDTVARFGGDEFAVLLEGGHEPPEHVADRIVRELRGSVDIDGQSMTITASVGLVTHDPEHGTQDGEQLLAAADDAMYAAKAGGKDRFATSPVGRHRDRINA